MADRVTVGICAHNEEETIGHLLDQVMEADVPVDQVIVVVAGNDSTGDIVRQKMESHPEIELVEEGSRRGQSAAQNEILSRAEAPLLCLIDGDGWLESGALSKLYDHYDGSAILYGREYPVLPDTFGGNTIAAFWDIHDRLSREVPTYTTQIALLPSNVIERIPPEIVIDDEYIAYHARRKGYDIDYVPEAVKRHNIKGDVKSFLRHRRKNWAGVFQMRVMHSRPQQPAGMKAYFYLRALAHAPLRKFPYYISAGILEIIAFLGGLWDAVRGRWPYIWNR